MNTNPLALPPSDPRADLRAAEGTVPELAVEDRQLRNERLQAAHRYLPCIIADAARFNAQRRSGAHLLEAGDDRYTQPRSWHALATRPIAMA